MRHKPKTKAQQLKAGIENSLQGFILPFTIKALAQEEESLNPQKMATDNIKVRNAPQK